MCSLSIGLKHLSKPFFLQCMCQHIIDIFVTTKEGLFLWHLVTISDTHRLPEVCKKRTPHKI